MQYLHQVGGIILIWTNSLHKLKVKFPHTINEIRGMGAINGISFNSPLEIFSKISGSIPIKFINDKKEFIEKLTVASIINHMYTEHNILTTVTLNPGDPLLSISPSLVASDEDISYFIESLEKTIAVGMNNLIFRFVKNNIYKLFN